MAQEVDTLPFELNATVEAWPTTELDSGWWPEEGPVRVRTILFAEGLAALEMIGESIVEDGASGATHRLESSDTDSLAEVAVNVAASLYLSLDVAGYTWEDVLHEQTVEFDASETFASLAFAEDGGASIALPMDEVEVFSVDQGILPLVNVVVTGTLEPTAGLNVVTDAIETNAGAFSANGQEMSTSGGSMDLDATGSLAAQLSLLVRGHAEDCISFVVCFGDFNYDFPLDPMEHTQEVVYESARLNHAEVAGAANDADESGAKSGGCSTLAAGPSHSGPLALTLLMIGALLRRRQR
jgi:MYXO-CTERM domain-containing protein